MKNRLIFILIIIVIIAGVAVYILYNDKPGWNFNLFGEDLKIEKTENVIQEIRKISELTSACYYEEVVIKDKKCEPTILNPIKRAINLGGDSCSYDIVLIARGKVRAGFDLSNISDDDFSVEDETLTVNVRCAEILDVIVNPSDYEVYYEEGKWSHEEIVRVQSKTAAKIRQDALNDGIIEKANRNGIDKLEMLLKPLGFKKVIINLQY